MNRARHRVKAFTLMELTISMLVTALVIGIAYTSYTIIWKSYLTFQSKNTEMETLLRLDEWLRKDFIRADSILKEPDGFACHSAGKQVKFEFTPEYIIRIASRRDTFKIKASALITSFEQMPVAEIRSAPEPNRIDELSFSILYQNSLIPYHYRKQYSSVNLINRNPDAIH